MSNSGNRIDIALIDSGDKGTVTEAPTIGGMKVDLNRDIQDHYDGGESVGH